MAKLTKAEKNEIFNKLVEEFGEYTLGETEVYDDSVHVEYYGKSYGSGSDGWGVWERAKAGFNRTEIDGYVPTYIEEFLSKMLFRYPQIKSFNVIAQLD